MTTDIFLPSIKNSSLGESAYQILREKIISRELAPGQRLNLGEISRQLNISKTPLKEALKHLEIEGLIAIEPRSGTYVTDPDPDEIAASFDLRRVLEVYAVELLAQNATSDDLRELQAISNELRQLVNAENRDVAYAHYLSLDHRFHRKLVALAQNPRLKEAHERENMHSQMARIRYRCPARDIDVPQKEHEHLIAALLDKDAEQAQTLISAHLTRAKQSLLEDMQVANDEL